METKKIKTIIKAALRVVSILPLAAVAAFGQQTINLTAGPTTTTMPDGSVVPMWGYSCGAAVSGATATCALLNPAAAATTTAPATWSPVVITVPTGQTLTINLTNGLSFTAGTGTNAVPTSLMIAGQLGAGLGTTATSKQSPDHTNAQPVTWPIAGTPPGAPPVGAGTPPPQGNRVQSFSTEVAAGATVPLTFGTATNPLRPGTYLIESGTHPSIQGPMGLYGILVVTCAPGTAATTACPAPATGAAPGTAYPAMAAANGVASIPAVTYTADVPLLLSEIDAVQNQAVQAAVTTAGFSETKVWSGQPGGCGNPSSGANYNTCYPPAVNYTPLYYLINGVAFNKTSAATSVFQATADGATVTVPATGTVLVRLVNAGLRMHVPSIVGSQTGTSGVSGFALMAEDGNPLPGVPHVQSEVFMAAGKTYDVMINVPATPTGATAPPALPIYDRELSLSGNGISRDAGMLAYIGINGGGAPASPALAAAVARPDTYSSVVAGKTLTVSDPSRGVIANDTNVYGVTLVGTVAGLTLNGNGTFTYTGPPTTFTYCANGSVTAGVCSSGKTAMVTLNAAPTEGASGITLADDGYIANGTSLSIKPSGILANDKDAAGYPLTVNMASVTPAGGLTVTVDPNGGFNASIVSCTDPAGCVTTFTYKAQNSQGTLSTGSATVTITFQAASNLSVTVLDPATKTAISDYRWIIEEDRTFYINPACTTNPPPAGCPSAASGAVPTFGTNFHTSYMPLIATGCTGPLSCESGQTMVTATGTHVAAVCDVGNGVCRPGSQQTIMMPGQVHLDPTKRYYISVLPGDAANPFNTGNAVKGHGMGGAPIACIPTAPAVVCDASGAFPAVTILTQATPFPTAKLSIFVFEDDFPLNGESDSGGATFNAIEPGLGQFNITLFDDAGGTGDATGQMTYDMFNMPLGNSLDGTVDPATTLNACPITQQGTGITGTIVTCPKYESDGITPSPLAGQAVVANMMPGRYGVVATPGADRIAKGEEWLQTNTLDGQKAHDSFLRIGEPSFFQEFGPAGYHVAIGFANPKIINDRLAGVCNGTDPSITGNCSPGNTLTGTVTTERMSRTPDERLYSSGDNSSFAFTQCYVSFGDPDGEDFAFTKCDSNGNFTLTGLPDGDWRITVFDQWNDMLVDGLSTPVRLDHTNPATGNVGQIAMNQWQANIYTSSFFDKNGNGVRDADEAGLSLVPTNIRFRDGSYSNFNNTDLSGNAGFNEVFPLFSWYVIESDSTRYKNTGTHVVYDAGGPADGTLTTCGGTVSGTGYPQCGNSIIGHFMANTAEQIPVPANLRVPGGFYCANADCTDASSPVQPGGSGGSTGRVDPPWVLSEGWQGFSGQNSFIEFGKKPYVPGETGGIRGEVIYASTRPFDDPGLLIHTSWTPDVPGVTINLYQEGTGPDGSQTLTLIDHTTTSSFDDWAQGFRSDGMPNMNCPGQGQATGTSPDLFFFTLYNQPMYLDMYNSQHSGTTPHTLPNNSQFKCYDGMHNWNQVQPAPYDGMYQFPSVTSMDPVSGKPTGTNCTACTTNPDSTDPYRYGTPMLPAGKYVVEMIVPPGYELVKEEDKNILIGDNYIAPATQQFGGLGSIYILPDQAEIASSYNANNAQNPTQTLGRFSLPSHEGDTGSVETFWPCVGASRIVPDYISLFPQSHEVSPFAGATRNLCDRKEVTLEDQSNALAKFWIFTSAHAAAHFTGVITDDYTSEFDPFSPQFGEKFSPNNMPVSIKDWTGTEIARVYSDRWGTYDGLTYSTWEVNPPNPTGYAPTMMVVCMNDPGPITDTRATIVNSAGVTVPNPTFGKLITDPQFTEGYSQFCYEIPFMPGQTQYMDTPVVPTSAFAGAGYNNVDCYYPDATPAISEVDGDGIGPYVSAAGSRLTITALGDQVVPNYAYAGPSATTAPYNQKTITRHYGFGAQTGAGGVQGSVTIGGVAATVNSWSDKQIVVTVPQGVRPCAVQQQAIYGGSAAQCGELVITASPTTTGGNVTGVTITRGGSYSAAPTVTFGAPPAGGTQATGTANLGGGGVTAVTVTNGGGGYTSAPTVTFTGGGGSGATATATMRKRVISVTITNGGFYPNGSPTVTFSTPSGTPAGTTATGTVTLNAQRQVTGVTINNPTTNNYPLTQTVTVTFSGGGTGHTNAVGNTTQAGDTTEYVSAVTFLSSGHGTGYTSAPSVGFTGGGGAGATATATIGGRAVVSVTITNAGAGYTTAPSVTFSAGATGGTSTATGTATIVPLATVPGKQSVDTVTITVGGKAPTHVAATESIQAAIDAASPGDLIIVDPTCVATGTGAAAVCSASAINGTTPSQSASKAEHNELLLMWKPVRLQGVGAASSIINANTQPAGKMNAWRAQVDCLIGLALNGQPVSATNPAFDPNGTFSCPGNGWKYFTPTAINPQVDRLPLESALGWDANLNGNLAELLQEPSLMGALEGAGITVLAKGVNFPSTPWDPTLLAGFPTGTTLLQSTLSSPGGAQCLDATNQVNPFPSNYSCNPSSIDGLGITDSSQGGGGIFVHGWGHNLQIANNRIYNNAGTLSGGINLGQGEFAPPYIQGNATNAPPGSCEESPVPNILLPYCEDTNVNMHNNWVSLNSSTGDELFSATPAGAGGVSICTGSDYYKFNYNWVCGNLSSGDGGGLGHLGFSYNGDIEHNTIIFNQSTNPTIPANGGGLIVMGTPDADPLCGTATDADCVPAPGSVGPSDGVGPGLVINANLIMGNAAESGSGGGIAFQAVNGSDMVAFPRDPGQWNTVTVTNNIVVDNVAGRDGAGMSLLDSSMVNIINNTIAYNSSTASAGTLLTTLGAPLASTPPPTGGTGAPCTANCGNTSKPQVAGVVAIQNSAILSANLPPGAVICPPGHFQPGTTNTGSGTCTQVSYPKLENNIIYQNSAYYIGVGALSPQFQQNVVSMYNAFAGSPAATQGATGQCVTVPNQMWDIGVRGDTGPTNHSSTVTLSPTASVIGSGGYAGSNSTGNPNFVSFYCDGARTPPEFGRSGWAVPPGISDATVPNPIFNLTPTATVDEGNNWVNLRWGPLSLTNPTVIAGNNGNYGGGLPLGNYSITTGSSAAGRVTGANLVDAPSYDFFDKPRKTGNGSAGSTDAGAVKLTGTTTGEFTVSPSSVDFGLVPVHSPTTVDQDILVTNSDIVPITINAFGINCAGVAGGTCSNASFSISSDPTGTCTNGTTLASGQSCVIIVVFNPTSTSHAARNANLFVTASGVTQNVALTGHDTFATLTITPGPPNTTPTLRPNPASTVATTGTITLTNTVNPVTQPDAGPILPTAITLTPTAGTGTWAVGGTCAVGTAINAGGTLNPPDPGSSCTITLTYTPPAGATGAALNGSARLTVTGYGLDPTTTLINAVYSGN